MRFSSSSCNIKKSLFVFLCYGSFILTLNGTLVYAQMQNKNISDRNHVTKAFLDETINITSRAVSVNNTARDIENITYISNRSSLLSLHALLSLLVHYQMNAIITQDRPKQSQFQTQKPDKFIPRLFLAIIEMTTPREAFWVKKELQRAFLNFKNHLSLDSQNKIEAYINDHRYMQKTDVLPFFYSEDITVQKGALFPFEPDFILDHAFHCLIQSFFNIIMLTQKNKTRYIEHLQPARASLLVLFLQIYAEIKISSPNESFSPESHQIISTSLYTIKKMATRFEIPYLLNLLSLITPESHVYTQTIKSAIKKLNVQKTAWGSQLPQMTVSNPPLLEPEIRSFQETQQKILDHTSDKGLTNDIFLIDSLPLEESLYHLFNLEQKLDLMGIEKINISELPVLEAALLLSIELETQPLQKINIHRVKEILETIELKATSDDLKKIAFYLIQVDKKLNINPLSVSPLDRQPLEYIHFLIFQMIGRLSTEQQDNIQFQQSIISYFTQLRDKWEKTNPKSPVNIYLDSLEQRTNQKSTVYPSIENDSGDRIQTVEKHLKDHLKGQPEVIQRILQIETQRSIFGHLGSQGLTLKFMGLPGVGKDTAAKAWIDGIHNKKGAWQEQQHLLSVPPIRNSMDMREYIGSSPGYIDSNNLPILINFLVQHSGGKYLIVSSKDLSVDKTVSHNSPTEKPWYVILNPEWQGQNLPGHHTPDQGIVFLNDVHDWSKNGRNFIKTFLEEGRIRIANSGTLPDAIYKNLPAIFVNEIIVPIIRIEASNELSYLIASNRRVDGTYTGSPLSEKALMDNWQRVHKDYTLLRKSLLDEGVARSSVGAGEHLAFGVSQEYLDRFNDADLLLFRPLTSKTVREILLQEIHFLVDELKASKTKFANIEWQFSEDLITFIQNWQQEADKSARFLKAKKESFLRASIVEAVSQGHLVAKEEPITISLDIKENKDGTSSLSFLQSNGLSYEVFIKETQINKHKEILSTQKMQHLYSLGHRLSQHVFGVEAIAQRLGGLVASELPNRNKNVTARTARRNAQTYVFLGLSSIGKTELAKTLAKEVYGDETQLLVIPFGDIKTTSALEEWLLGGIYNGKVKRSKLMEIWDRTNGQFILVLDEITNAPEAIQESLYDLFRENIYSNFVDREPRPTENLIIIVSDNATQEWYAQMQRDVSMVEQQAAFYSIYKEAMEDTGFLRHSLEKHFKNALINRVGLKNIFFFPPLSYQSIRHIVHRHILKGIARLAPQSRDYPIGWHIEFLSQQDFKNIVKVVEVEGFELFEQGASLIHFIEDDIFRPLNILLGQNGVAIASTVVLYLKNISEKQVTLGVLTNDGRDLSFNIQRRKDFKDIQQIQTSPTETFLTALHEAGHSLMSQILFRDIYQPDELGIIAGVAKVDNKWKRILGVSKATKIRNFAPTKEAFIARMAVLSGGYVAEELTTKGRRSAAGKGNDIQRITHLAYEGILCVGLSSLFGNMSCPEDTSFVDWMKTFPEEKRQRVIDEVNQWINQAYTLAQQALISHFDILLALGEKLATNGKLNATQIKKFYKGVELKEPPYTNVSLKKIPQKGNGFLVRDMQLRDDIQKPKVIMDHLKYLMREKSKELALINIPKEIPFVANPDHLLSMMERKTAVSLPQIYRYDIHHQKRNKVHRAKTGADKNVSGCYRVLL